MPVVSLSLSSVGFSFLDSKQLRLTSASSKKLRTISRRVRQSSSRARVVSPAAYTQWLLDKPGCVAARSDDLNLIPNSTQAELGRCPLKPIDLTHLVQACAEEGEECVIENAMFAIEGDHLFISNVSVASASSEIIGGGEAKGINFVEVVKTKTCREQTHRSLQGPALTSTRFTGLDFGRMRRRLKVPLNPGLCEPCCEATPTK